MGHVSNVESMSNAHSADKSTFVNSLVLLTRFIKTNEINPI